MGFCVILNLYNGHEAELNCASVSQKIRVFDKHRKSIGYFIKNELFLINDFFYLL